MTQDELIKRQLSLSRKYQIALRSIEPSPLKQSKYRITLLNGKRIDYGRTGYSDFLIHKDEARRARFHARFRSNKGYNDPSSPLFYSRLLLWWVPFLELPIPFLLVIKNDLQRQQYNTSRSKNLGVWARGVVGGVKVFDPRVPQKIFEKFFEKSSRVILLAHPLPHPLLTPPDNWD
jgi:hypothetical protein